MVRAMGYNDVPAMKLRSSHMSMAGRLLVACP
jgi:hypothetical protein